MKVMKRIAFLMFALLMAGTMTMAQGPRRGGGERERDPKAHAERMTERMVKEYSLNDTQKQQLLEANLEMVQNMGERNRPEPPKEKAKEKKGKEKKETDRPSREELQKKMKESREAYDAKLKQIMTKEQYEAYTKNREERAKRGEGNRMRGEAATKEKK